MQKGTFPEAVCPLILRFHRLMDAFAKSDDERDFYLDKVEGFLLYVDLDKSEESLLNLDKELKENADRYLLVPKMTFYESKKFMEGFINEKVYDIDTKEKLVDIIQSKNARDSFLEFIYDHLHELEKWQNYYMERSRIRIIEWLRQYNITFVFEEDLQVPRMILEKLKKHLFDTKVPKDIASAREELFVKSKTYYSSDAINPRPKRGRPPKQAVKAEVEPQVSVDLYTQVPSSARAFLYVPDFVGAHATTFSTTFDTEADLLASLRGGQRVKVTKSLEKLTLRLESLQNISDRVAGSRVDRALRGEDTEGVLGPLKHVASAEGGSSLTGVVQDIFSKDNKGSSTSSGRSGKKKVVSRIKHPKS